MANLTEGISVEDFQEYQDPVSVAQTPHLSRQRASLQVCDLGVNDANHSFEDNYDQRPESSLSGSGQQSSETDEAVFDISSRHSSPRTSHHSDDEISEFPHELQDDHLVSDLHRSSSPYTPIKMRSPFRNPSSVRAMQMDTTPPSYLTSPQSQHRYNFTSLSRNGTPRSTRSHNSAMRSPSKISPTKKMKKEYPLVLLHVTLLPIPIIYSVEVMEKTLPAYILENWKMLREKATDTVLARGILIPHPKEDYDLLEERLLESLELKLPRILKCGHFHLDVDEATEAAEGTDFDAEDYDSDDDADVCDDCGRRIRDGRLGSGTGHKRWDIKLFAANGLMRAGAWGAAWREMERVDVEIIPWMDENMKRELELRREEEEEEERQISEPFPVVPEDILHEVLKPATMDDARMREIYGDNAQQYVDGLIDDENPIPNVNASPSPQPHYKRPLHHHQDIPLLPLLRNYIYLASQDRRNIAIFFLSMLVLLLSIGAFTKSPPPPPPFPAPHVPKYDLAPTPSILSDSSFISSPLSTASPGITASSDIPGDVEYQRPGMEEAVDEVLGEMASEV